MRAWIFQSDQRRPWLAARSQRSLRAAGFDEIVIGDAVSCDAPCLLLRAGLILHDPSHFRPPPEVGNLMAVGLPIRFEPSSEWSQFQSLHGGHFPESDLPPPLCEWHSSGANALARLRGNPFDLTPLIVHWSRLDHALDDPTLFVMEVVTSVQHGGAERITCDLAMNLPNHGVRSRLVSLGKPNRTPLQVPMDTLDLSDFSRSSRIGVLNDIAVATGVDVFHLHLTNADDTREISASGIPVIATVHNSQEGWPHGWDTLQPSDVSLLLACSQSTESELRAVLPKIPVRTVWNGIQPNHFPECVRPKKENSFILACVANPRPQKRMHLLPEILAECRDEFTRRGIKSPILKLVIAGEVSPELTEAVDCRDAVAREAENHGVNHWIEWTEGKRSVREVLESANALISCSAHEGLSLAHLEALSSGLPVVACDTGGTRELAWGNPAITLLSADASPAEFAKAIVDVFLAPPPSGHRLIWEHFSTDRMTSRVAMFARQTASHQQGCGETIWFITNNLSTGGAQSSLRRLLKKLQDAGGNVRVALLQEYPEYPTAGREDLLASGIKVFVPPPAGLIGPSEAVERILLEMTEAPPSCVVFWNAITTHKLLLADAVPFTKFFDISPGEMWFTSMERYFHKPLPGLPYRSMSDYGNLLEGVVVKYHAEAPRAAALGIPVTVIPNGVALPPKPERRAIGSPFVLGTAARISPQKKLEELMDAFRCALPSLPDTVLCIAGGVETGAEEYAADLMRMTLDIPVKWLGEIHDLAAFHRDCDVFVMISDPAGCPNASLEALASGLPVIATDIGGASEQVIDGITGLLVAARDVAALANAMIRLHGDCALRDSLGFAARVHIEQKFTLDRMAGDYLKLFTGISTANSRSI